MSRLDYDSLRLYCGVFTSLKKSGLRETSPLIPGFKSQRFHHYHGQWRKLRAKVLGEFFCPASDSVPISSVVYSWFCWFVGGFYSGSLHFHGFFGVPRRFVEVVDATEQAQSGRLQTVLRGFFFQIFLSGDTNTTKTNNKKAQLHFRICFSIIWAKENKPSAIF
jgi:hypothetical protein